MKGRIPDLKEEKRRVENLSSREELDRFISARLDGLLLHCGENVPYYSGIFRSPAVPGGNIHSHEDLPRIPVLTREVLQNNRENLASADHASRGSILNSSGGSTGEPVHFLQDAAFRSMGDFVFLRYLQSFFVKDARRVRKLVVWGSDRDILKGSQGVRARITNAVNREVLLNSFRMSADDISKYIRTINSYKPELVRGYAGSLYEIAKYATANDLPLHAPGIVISQAETLTDEMRSRIREAFQADVVNFYGSRETASVAGECACHTLHSFSYYNLLEILGPDGTPARKGDTGRVVVTNLYNYAMPLVRYEIGDMGIPGDTDRCACGSILPQLKQITGRIVDHFRLRNGTVIPGEFFIHFIGVTCNRGGILKFQVIQRDYDRVVIRAVVSRLHSGSEKSMIEENIRRVMGPACRIDWELVDDIAKTASGKFRYTISEVGSGGQ